MLLNLPTWDQQQFLDALRKFVPSGDPRAIVFQTAARERCARQSLYTLGLQNVAKATGIRATATPAGWRHLAAASDLAVAAHGRELQTITSLTAGPQVHSALTTLASVQRWGAAQTNPYEILTLRVPGARVEAYWLRHYNGPEADDYIWPFLTLNRQLSAKQVWKVEEFLGALNAAAQKDLTFFENRKDLQDQYVAKGASGG
jgi:hypothetical protein